MRTPSKRDRIRALLATIPADVGLLPSGEIDAEELGANGSQPKQMQLLPETVKVATTQTTRAIQQIPDSVRVVKTQTAKTRQSGKRLSEIPGLVKPIKTQLAKTHQSGNGTFTGFGKSAHDPACQDLPVGGLEQIPDSVTVLKTQPTRAPRSCKRLCELPDPVKSITPQPTKTAACEIHKWIAGKEIPDSVKLYKTQPAKTPQSCERLFPIPDSVNGMKTQLTKNL